MIHSRCSLRLLHLLPLLAVTKLLAAVQAFAVKWVKEVAAFYGRAVELIARQDYRGATIELTNALQADPTDLFDGRETMLA